VRYGKEAISAILTSGDCDLHNIATFTYGVAAFRKEEEGSDRKVGGIDDSLSGADNYACIWEGWPQGKHPHTASGAATPNDLSTQNSSRHFRD